MAREDTFAAERAHLGRLSDAELEARFWELAQKVVDPLVDLARTHTSPSIERSVLMRMGLDSMTCAAIVAETERRGLLGHGAGHLVWHCSMAWEVTVPEAARRLADGEGWDTVLARWGGTR